MQLVMLLRQFKKEFYDLLGTLSIEEITENHNLEPVIRKLAEVLGKVQ